MEIQLWREILEPYGQAVDELVVKFNHIKQEYQNARMYSPIESVSGRVKSISSIMEKTQRKNVRIEELEDKIEDIAGIRIICQFVEDINTVVKICFCVLSCHKAVFLGFFHIILFIQHLLTSQLLPYTSVHCDTGISTVLQSAHESGFRLHSRTRTTQTPLVCRSHIP